MFPWNLPYPQNFVVAWYGPRYGLKIPKAPKSACLPPPPPKDPKDTKGGKDTASGSTDHDPAVGGRRPAGGRLHDDDHDHCAACARGTAGAHVGDQAPGDAQGEEDPLPAHGPPR